MTSNRQSLEVLLSSKRILVLGPCGSGKTWLTRQLSEILGLPAIHLDARFWKPGWISTPQPEWRGVVSSLVEQESWIMDGTYESTLDLRIPAAEAIIMVNRPRWSCLWGVARRSMHYRNKTRPDAPSDQPIDLGYLKYIWNYPVQTDALVSELIRQYGKELPVIRLDNRKGVEALIAALRDSSGGVAV